MITLGYGKPRTWVVLLVLLLLCVVPVAAGISRLVQLAGGAAITPENARFFAAPLPVVLHIVSSSLYAVLGAFQFVPNLRRRRHRWHRVIGWLLVPCGLAAALSGLWMTQFYPWPKGDGEILYGIRLVVGTGMVFALLLGVAALRQRNMVTHGAWMLRAYALGLGAGTQVLTHLPWVLFFGAPDELTRAMLMGAGWGINLLVAEWLIHRRLARPRRTYAVAVY